MKIEALAVPDAWLCTPRVHADDRGMFLEWYRGDLLAEATGRRFDIVQANHSRSKRGVVRGLHYALLPPGQAKLVYCPSGSVLDVVVDLRVGSPTFGVVDSVVLDEVDRCALFIAEGLGHAFCALSDDASLTYLVSSVYNPAIERGVSPLDADLDLPWPMAVADLELSDKDRDAPTLAAAITADELPTYEACRAAYASQS